MNYTQPVSNFLSNAQSNAAKSLEQAKQDAKDKLFKRKQRERFIGANEINPQGQHMAEVGRRFIENSVNFIEDPAFDFIRFQINWADPSGLFADESNTNSALRFLKDIGETTRYDQLKRAIELLKEYFDATSAGTTKDYALKSVTGFSNLNENYSKLGVPSEVQLHCIEDVRWHIRAINALIGQVCYDKVRQLSILPRNLRRFSGSFLITDMRDLDDIDANGNVIDKVDDNTQYMFNDELGTQMMLVSCPAIYFAGNKYIPDEVNNAEPTELQGDLNLEVWSYKYDFILPALQAYVLAVSKELEDREDANTPSGKKKWSKIIWSAVKGVAVGILANAAQAAMNKVKSYAMNAAYDFLEDSGAVDWVNGAMKYTKPEYLLAQFGDKIDGAFDKALGRKTKTVVDSIYFTDKRYVIDDMTAQQQYAQTLKYMFDDYEAAKIHAERQYNTDKPTVIEDKSDAVIDKQLSMASISEVVPDNEGDSYVETFDKYEDKASLASSYIAKDMGKASMNDAATGDDYVATFNELEPNHALNGDRYAKDLGKVESI